MLEFEKFKQLELNGTFTDERTEYLLSALCRLYINYFAGKCGKSAENVHKALTDFAQDPAAVKFAVPTKEDLEREKALAAQRREENDRQFAKGLMALASKHNTTPPGFSMDDLFRRIEHVID